MYKNFSYVIGYLIDLFEFNPIDEKELKLYILQNDELTDETEQELFIETLFKSQREFKYREFCLISQCYSNSRATIEELYDMYVEQ